MAETPLSVAEKTFILHGVDVSKIIKEKYNLYIHMNFIHLTSSISLFY